MAAGKYRTAAVTAQGDVYMWEGWSKALPSGASPAPQGVSLGSLGGSTGGSLGGGFTPVRQSRASRSSEGAEVSNGRSGSLSKKAVIAASTEILPHRCVPCLSEAYLGWESALIQLPVVSVIVVTSVSISVSGRQDALCPLLFSLACPDFAWHSVQMHLHAASHVAQLNVSA